MSQTVKKNLLDTIGLRKIGRAVFFWTVLVTALATSNSLAREDAHLLVQDGGSLEAFLSGVKSADLRLAGACASLDGAAGNVTLNLVLDGDSARINGAAQLTPGRRALARGALQVVEALAAFGLTSPVGNYVLSIRDGVYEVGDRARGVRQFSSACDALGHLLTLIVLDAGTAAPDILRSAVRASNGSITGVSAALRRASRELTFIGRGRAHTLNLSAAEAAGFDIASAAGTDGLHILAVRQTADGGMEIDIQVSNDADLGTAAVYFFAGRDRMTPTLSAPVQITGGNAAKGGEQTAPIPLVLGSSKNAQIALAGETQPFVLEVPRAGTIIIQSTGAADLVGDLRTNDGELIAANDDSGDVYNFRIEQSVEPGTYTLDVAHCCGGTGNFTVSTDLR